MRREKQCKINDLGLLETLFKKSGDGVLIANAKTKKFIFANARICSMLGYEKRELLKLGVKDIHRKEDLKHVLKEFAAGLSGKKRLAKALPVLRKNREILYCDIGEMKAEIKGESVVIGFFRDVTDIICAEKKIRESEKRNIELLNGIPSSFVLFDLEGKIIFINKVGARHFRGKASDLIGKSIYDIMPELKEQFKKRHDRIIKSGRTQEFEDDIKMPDGKVKTFLTILKPVKNELGKVFAIQANSYELTERRNAERVIKENELLLTEMFEGSAIPMFMIDKNHKITRLNRACEKIFNIPAKKMIGTSLQWKPFYSKPRPVLSDLIVDNLTKEDLKKWYSRDGKLTVKKSVFLPKAYEGIDYFPLAGKNGRWISFTAAPIMNEKGEIVGAIETIEDVTEKKIYELILAENEKRFRDLYENIPGAAYRCANDKYWTMLFVSKAIEEICGYRSDEIIGNKIISYEKIIYSADRDRIREVINKAIKQDEMFEIEYRIISKNKEIKWIYERGKATIGEKKEIKHIDGLLFDITERKIIEKKLEKSEKRYRALVEFASDSILFIDTKGVILEANKAITEVLGYKKEYIIGKKISELKKLIPSESMGIILKNFSKRLMGLKPAPYVINLVSTKGEIRFFEISASLIKDEKKVMGVLAIIRDVTEREKGRQALKEDELKFRTLFEGANDGIFIMKGDKFIDCNRRTLEMFKCKREDIIGRSPYRLSPLRQSDGRYSKEKAIKMIKAVLTEGPQYFEWKHVKFDGTLFDVEVGLSKVIIGKEEFILAIIRDVTEQERNRQALKESEYKYRTLVTNIPNAVYTTLPDKHRTCVFMSERWGKWTGFPPEEFYSNKHLWFKTVHPNDRKNVSLKILNAYLARKSYILEYRLINYKTKEERYILDQGIPNRNENGEIINYNGIATDITELKKVGKKLQDSEERFRDITFSSGDIVWEIDKNAKYTFVAGSPEKILKYSADEMIGKTWFDFMPKDEADRVKKITENIFSCKLPIVDLENWQLSRDGKSYIFLANGVPIIGEKGRCIGYRGVEKDITKRKIAENEVRVSEEKLRTVVENIGDGVFVLDRDYRIVMFNKQASIISGFSKEEVLGKHYEKVLHFVYETTGEENREFIDLSLGHGMKAEMKNYTQLIRKDGEKVVVADSASTLRDERGRIMGCVVVFRDVSREREIDKMKSEFISVASHQLKTPLSGIKWFTELLLREKVGDLNEKQKDFVNQVKVSNERLIALVSDLLSVSRIETNRKFEIKKKKINICQVIDEAIKLNIPIAKRFKVKVSREQICNNRILMYADEDKIQQVFFNLITNSIKYSKKDGEVFIGFEVSAKEIIFFVRDNGIGIEERDFPKVFTKFYRGDNAIKSETDGTGLGLYIAKAIIEAHDGSIWFDSKKGKGTTFYFSIQKG